MLPMHQKPSAACLSNLDPMSMCIVTSPINAHGVRLIEYLISGPVFGIPTVRKRQKAIVLLL